MSITALGWEHFDALTRFFHELPASDLTFVKEDVTDADTIRSWLERDSGRRWVSVEGDDVTGYLAVRPLPGWSNHVGEVRLVVHPAHRRTGLGRELARHALARSLEAGLSKIVVELVADQQHAVAMFTELGFTGEALLHDHIRDRAGELRDLLMLAHYVDATWSGLTSVGLADELGAEGNDR